MAVSQVRVASRVWIYPVISLQMTLMFCEAPSEQLGHPNGLCFEPYWSFWHSRVQGWIITYEAMTYIDLTLGSLLLKPKVCGILLWKRWGDGWKSCICQKEEGWPWLRVRYPLFLPILCHCSRCLFMWPINWRNSKGIFYGQVLVIPKISIWWTGEWCAPP